ncbi:MAG: alcohol dehydrogenase catalytic domain-containing protein [Terriglobia bacterium]
MKAAFITGIRQLAIGELPDLQLASPRDVLVRVDAVGVCGSDIHYYTKGRIGSQRVKFPETIGHECAGAVVEAGSAVTRLRVGQRVAVDPLMPCGQCDQCLSGRMHTCRNQRFLGCPGEAPGAISERLLMPARCCYPIPDSMSMAQAAMVEPLSIGLYAARMAGIRAGREASVRDVAKVAILGSGPIGLCVLLACLTEARCTTYVTDLLSERLAVAMKCGAVWTGNPQKSDVVKEIAEREPLGVDFVFECAGKQETLNQAIEILKPGGTLLIVGIPEIDRVSFMIHNLRRKEITLRNVRRQNECTAAAIELIADGHANVDPLVTHHFPLAGTKAAFDLVTGYRDGVVKAMIHVSA